MPKNYKEIHTLITERYQLHYMNNPTSDALAEDIKDLNIDDVIQLLKDIKENSELIKLSLNLSRRSDLFDKLILMKGEVPHEWVLRLHIYNMVTPCDEPGYVISNLNRKIRDDENHIHEHSWQLASRFLMGGFRNHQYAKTSEGPLYSRFNLVPTSKDGVTRGKSSRKAVLEGETGILEISDEVYQQGDLVHYPIEIPHKVDTNLASYVGMTITLAHTSQRHHENSIFYEKTPDELMSPGMKELDVEAQKYTEEEYFAAVNMAITNLQLLKLCDQLAAEGFDRFNRYMDPITKQLIPSNVLETELLPTIAILELQKDDVFIEYPMTAELMGKTESEIQQLKEECAASSEKLKMLINNAIIEMHFPSLMQHISVSQHNLLSHLYTSSPDDLEPCALSALTRRKTTKPAHIHSNWAEFFSHKIPHDSDFNEKTEQCDSPVQTV